MHIDKRLGIGLLAAVLAGSVESMFMQATDSSPMQQRRCQDATKEIVR